VGLYTREGGSVVAFYLELFLLFISFSKPVFQLCFYLLNFLFLPGHIIFLPTYPDFYLWFDEGSLGLSGLHTGEISKK
jgi:hypothetical protein